MRRTRARDRGPRDREAHADYLMRSQTASARPPTDATAVLYLSSSPEAMKGRFCVVPSQLG